VNMASQRIVNINTEADHPKPKTKLKSCTPITNVENKFIVK